MVFPVVMYGCERWTVKKAEHRRIDAFKLWCWRRLLRGPWTARRSNQSILKEISPGFSLVGMMLKLKLQYFAHLMWRVDSLEKCLMLGGIGGQEEKGMTEDEMAVWHHWLDEGESEWTLGVGDGQGWLACCDSWGCKESDRTERINWTELILSKVHASVFMNMEPSLSLPLVKRNVNPRVWADGKSAGRTQNAIPVVVKLKYPHLFPHKKQYPLKPEVKEGLKRII